MKHILLFTIPIVCSAASVTVSWDAPLDTAVTSHVVRYGLTTESKTNVVTVTGTNSVAIIVPDNARLVLDVTAVNSIGMKSLPTPEISFSTTVPSAPTNVRVIAQ